MKKIFLSVAAVIAMSVMVQAQFSNVKFGIKAGGNLSTQHGLDASSASLLSKGSFRGYHAGLIADVAVTEHFYLQPQLLYVRKGARYVGTTDGFDTKLTMHTVEMPLNLLYKGDLSFGKVFLGAGPVIGYAFSGKQEQNGQSQKLYKNGLNNWRRIDISANATAGVEFDNGFFASVNYQRGFKDVYKGDVNVKNRSVSLSVGYLLDRSKSKRKG
jgi:hypothetical protein